MNLLIVNDEEITAETMRTDIDWARYGIQEVYTAYDAEAARERILKSDVDLLLCDIEMPGENGLELLRWVRENRAGIECVFLTCHASFGYAREAISLGCQDYILVPARYEDIGAVIQRVVGRMEEQRDARRYQEYGKYMLEEQIRREEKEKEAEKEQSLTPEETVEQVIRCIMEQLRNSSLSVDYLAEAFHFHPVYLNRVFKKVRGISISQFIINERMKLAGNMLDISQYSANEIAEKVGYSHYTNFYNMFKKYYGMSPAQYQEKKQNPV